MSGLIIHNHGPLIVATNFWDLPESKLGKLLVSLNAGAFRILLPVQAEGYLEDLRSAEGCAVTRGSWPEQGLADAAEVLFDDGTGARRRGRPRGRRLGLDPAAQVRRRSAAQGAGAARLLSAGDGDPVHAALAGAGGPPRPLTALPADRRGALTRRDV
jgi:hypothetical protein